MHSAAVPDDPNAGLGRSDPVRVSGPDVMRRAIRAVTFAQFLRAQSAAQRERRAVERLTWQGDRFARSGPADEPAADEAADAAILTLRRAVEGYVRNRREAGDGPERMVVALKAAVNGMPAADLPMADRPLVFEVIVPWGIEEYFDGPPSK